MTAFEEFEALLPPGVTGRVGYGTTGLVKLDGEHVVADKPGERGVLVELDDTHAMYAVDRPSVHAAVGMWLSSQVSGQIVVVMWAS